jgi:beta-glucosidase-like glycosyl hydrolase
MVAERRRPLRCSRSPDGRVLTRHTFDATITAQDLTDSYLPPFQACVERGNVSGLMCSVRATMIAFAARRRR